MSTILIKNARLFDGAHAEYPDSMHILIENNLIREVSDAPIIVSNADVIDVKGRMLMPGLIDAHIHAYTPTFSLFENDHMLPSLLASYAGSILRGMLHRGFTTVRDAG